MRRIEPSKAKIFSTFFSYPETLPEFSDTDKIHLREDGEKFCNFPELQVLQNEYVRLFINALPEAPCSPYASVYLEGTLMGAVTVEIGEIYGKYGLSLKESELPDHIAVELEFLGLLAVLSESNKLVLTDYDFVISHLRSWIPNFLGCVEKNDRTGFYKSLATAIREWLF